MPTPKKAQAAQADEEKNPTTVPPSAEPEQDVARQEGEDQNGNDNQPEKAEPSATLDQQDEDQRKTSMENRTNVAGEVSDPPPDLRDTPTIRSTGQASDSGATTAQPVVLPDPEGKGIDLDATVSIGDILNILNSVNTPIWDKNLIVEAIVASQDQGAFEDDDGNGLVANRTTGRVGVGGAADVQYIEEEIDRNPRIGTRPL